MRHITLLVLLALVITSGCQTVPGRAPDVVIADRDAELARLIPWVARGSLSVDSKAQGVINATFTWNATQAGFDIRLIGPLGMNTYRITEDQSGARVTGENQEFAGDSAEALLQEALGVLVPLEKMQDWVVGLQGDATDVRRDRLGRIKKMRVTDDEQSHWDVTFERYGSFEALELPRLILVSGDDVEIKLAIRNWSRPVTVDQNRMLMPVAGSN